MADIIFLSDAREADLDIKGLYRQQRANQPALDPYPLAEYIQDHIDRVLEDTGFNSGDLVRVLAVLNNREGEEGIIAGAHIAQREGGDLGILYANGEFDKVDDLEW